ncbi:dephospho-CoA kinase [Flavobacterium glycines]|uniref:Dephospho-CoA kinase n=1 Tax=Flavobacterium glycines TaxID=551990 RepID=A0A1B9DZ71_9FLAO|nr:dephospho-CoA kinase [Flavobacterium glycines]OCB74967.1 dephospho-CoA kinase [Flavobacterium glycines]GEL11253.1 dephospho-CoA kinase [Flavobacterium glycines]SDJ44720.1 dephospho-CoA kinase [Flavobacterium glycines]
MPKIIGLTGGIGSGKTTIANYLVSLGYPVYIADDAGRKVMQKQEIIDAIKEKFGLEIFENNLLNRAKLAKIVFDNPEQLKKLNAIVHPAVKEDFKNWLTRYLESPLVFYESAILFESGSYNDFDVIITVIAPLEKRIARVLERDNSKREQVLNRINAQWTDEQRISKSDFVIENLNIDLAKQKMDEFLKILLIS